MNIKNNKGAATLFVLVSGLFFIAFLVSILMITSVKRQTQAQATKQTQEIYSNGNEEEIYQSYFGGNAVPIYTAEQFKKMCSNEIIMINEAGGKYYTFANDAIYVLFNNLEFEYNGTFEPQFDENNVGRIEGNGKTVKIRDTSKATETYYYYNSDNNYKYPVTETNISYAGMQLYFDGINNTGNGHNGESNSWKDLSGNQLNNISISNASWNIDSLSLTENNTGVFLNNILENLFKDNNTIEIVIQGTNYSEKTALIGNENSIAYERTSSSDEKGNIVVYGNGGSLNLTTTEKICEYEKKCTLTWKWNKDDNSISIYENGKFIEKIQSNTIGEFNSNWSSIWIGKDSTNSENDFLGNLYSVRVYNRILEDKEIENNHVIDDKRFIENKIENEEKNETISITYCFGNMNFLGSNCLNTGIPLFNTSNLNRDFNISFNLSNFEYLSGQNNDRNVIMCNQNEAANPYQGFAFQYRDEAIRYQVNITSIQNAIEWGKSSGDILFSRRDNKFYIDDNYIADFTNIAKFDAPLSFGANLDASLNPRRFCKADLENINVEMLYDKSELINTSLPLPTRTAYVFDGWYTMPNGEGEKITDTNQITKSAVTLYVNWISNITLVTQPDGESAKFLGGTIAKNEIESVRITTSIDGANSTKWNVSTANDNSILAWYTDEDEDGLYEVTIGSTAGNVVANNDSSNLFSYIGYNSNSDDTTCIYGIENLDVTHVTNMKGMFNRCGTIAMTSLDLGNNFDTSKVTNMENMFNLCGYTAMTSLNLGNKFDTNKVTNMKSMFKQCGYTAMTSLDLKSEFNTINVENMQQMFQNCGKTAMTRLNLGNKFDTRNAENMQAMFDRCGYKALTSLNLGDKFNTIKVTNMQQMFNECGRTAMTSLDIRAMVFNTDILTNYTNIFANCGKNENCTVYANQAYSTFIDNNKSSRWSSIVYVDMSQ